MDEFTPRGKPSYPLTLDLPRAEGTLLSQIRQRELQRAISLLSSKCDVYLVGGAVRDAILGTASHDIDLAVSLLPEEVQTILQEENFRVIETGVEHGTLTFLIDDQEGVEITTFRKPSARDETAFGQTIEEDLSGRDFTINAIAYDITHKKFIDPFNGIEDLKNGICRAVGNAEQRFSEDPLRILRAVRFGVAEGRALDEDSQQAARSLMDQLSSVSVERIRNELLEIFTRPYPDEALKQLLSLGAIELLLPELLAAVGCEQNEFHIHDVFDHTAWVLGRSIDDPLVRIASLLHDIGKPATVTVSEDGRRHFYKHENIGAEMSKQILERLKFSKSDTKRITRLVKEHMRSFECGPSGVRRIMRDLEEDFDLWLALKRADAPPVVPYEDFQATYDQFIAMVDEEHERQKGPAYGKLAVNGNDLIELGVEPGPRLGQILNALEEAVIEDPTINDRARLIELAKERISS